MYQPFFFFFFYIKTCRLVLKVALLDWLGTKTRDGVGMDQNADRLAKIAFAGTEQVTTKVVLHQQRK